MNKIIKPTRIFLGIFFITFGLNGLALIFLGNGFLPMPAPSEQFLPIMMGLFSSKFVMPTAKIIQFFSGLLLLTNKYLNLALLLLAPVLYSILASHLIVADFAGIPLGIVGFVAWLILVIDRKKHFFQLFSR